MERKNYNHLFFDLDHTLWDFRANSEETLIELFETFALGRYCSGGSGDFLRRYYHHNGYCWERYRNGEMSKKELRTARFSGVLGEYDIRDADLIEELSAAYLQHCPLKTHLMPHAVDTLTYLAERYKLHLITNGFHETQMIKLKNSGLSNFFGVVITADQAGSLKPDSRIFHLSLNEAKASVHDTIYIGDHLDSDVRGARNAGIDQVFYNPRRHAHDEQITFEVYCLSELQVIF